MPTRRQRKISELLHEEISGIIQYQSQDPRLTTVTVTGVNVTADLLTAQVYVTVLGDQSETQEALAGLAKAASFIRYKLGQTISLRRIPELTFKLDHSLEYAMHIESLLEQIKDEETKSSSAIESSPKADSSTGVEVET